MSRKRSEFVSKDLATLVRSVTERDRSGAIFKVTLNGESWFVAALTKQIAKGLVASREMTAVPVPLSDVMKALKETPCP